MIRQAATYSNCSVYRHSMSTKPGSERDVRPLDCIVTYLQEQQVPARRVYRYNKQLRDRNIKPPK